MLGMIGFQVRNDEPRNEVMKSKRKTFADLESPTLKGFLVTKKSEMPKIKITEKNCLKFF